MNLYRARRSEATEQITVISWCNQAAQYFPELRFIYHVPNGGSRNKAEAANLKAEGVKAGVPDLMFPFPHGAYIGLVVEMKFGSNRESEDQIEWLQALQAAGHCVAVCYSSRTALDLIERYIRFRSGERLNAEIGKHGYPVFKEPTAGTTGLI